MTDYRAYATLFIGVWVSCLPKTYVWCLRVGFVLVLVGFCSLFFFLWKLITKVTLRICSCIFLSKRRSTNWKWIKNKRSKVKQSKVKQSPKHISISLENLLSKSRPATIEESSVLLSPAKLSRSSSCGQDPIIHTYITRLAHRFGKFFAQKKN